MAAEHSDSGLCTQELITVGGFANLTRGVYLTHAFLKTCIN